MSEKLCIFTTGGTIDKVYFDANSQFEVGSSVIEQVLHEAQVKIEYRIEALMKKDSLEISADDRVLILDAVRNCPEQMILITHGTDTMAETGRYLSEVTNKTIVLTGSLSPARFRATDAVFNIGLALGALQSQSNGVYIAMNGQIFDAGKVKKDTELQQFVHTE
jgi:L-asparaginase